MRLRSYALAALVLVISTAGIALNTSPLPSNAIEPATSVSIDIDTLHSKIEMEQLPVAQAFDAM